MKKNGFTLVELIAVIVILGIIALIVTPIISDIINSSREKAYKEQVEEVIRSTERWAMTNNTLLPVVDQAVYYLSIPVLKDDGFIKASDIMNPLDGEEMNGCVLITYQADSLQYNYTYEENECSTSILYNSTKGVNKPQLAAGMTPIIWDGDSWEEVAETNQNWYDYTAKKWANAITEDGSMWVWIPRYIYKISSGWHTATAGVIDVRFSKAYDDTIGGTTTIVDTGSATDSNGTWTNHPAFWWDNDSDGVRETGEELSGIWIAKFEPTAVEGVANPLWTGITCAVVGDDVSTKTVKIIPNANSWRCISLNNMFTVSRNMETNTVYGWGTTGDNIDTHMMKNMEWGAVAYISHSVYGKDGEEIWINPADTFTTGCAGNSVSTVETVGCIHTYETQNGVETSSTGTIYGIYDISGSAWDYTSAYVNNGNAALDRGTTIRNADSKYKDVYEKATTETGANNYALTINRKGDSIYETSTYGSYTSWYADWSSMAGGSGPWFGRGAMYLFEENAGSFGFSAYTGQTTSYNTFRPILIVGEGF